MVAQHGLAEKGLPDSCDSRNRQEYQVIARLGTETHSTPVVAGDECISAQTTASRATESMRATAGFDVLRREDGKISLATRGAEARGRPYFDWPNTGISSSVTVEGDRVYLTDNRGEVVCLDARGMANGNDGRSRTKART